MVCAACRTSCRSAPGVFVTMLLVTMLLVTMLLVTMMLLAALAWCVH